MFHYPHAWKDRKHSLNCIHFPHPNGRVVWFSSAGFAPIFLASNILEEHPEEKMPLPVKAVTQAHTLGVRIDTERP